LQNDVKDIVKVEIGKVEEKWRKMFDDLRKQCEGIMPKPPQSKSKSNDVYSSVRQNLTQPKKDVEFVIFKNMHVGSWDEVDTLMHAWAFEHHIDVCVKRAEGEGKLGRTRKTYCCKHAGKAPQTQEMTTKTGCPFSANWNEKGLEDGKAVLCLTTLHAEHNHPVGPGKTVAPQKNPFYQGKTTKRKIGKEEVKKEKKVAETKPEEGSRVQPKRAAKKQKVKMEKEE
jgi:hypothetical protein